MSDDKELKTYEIKMDDLGLRYLVVEAESMIEAVKIVLTDRDTYLHKGRELNIAHLEICLSERDYTFMTRRNHGE